MGSPRENTNTHSTTAPYPRPESARAYLMRIAGTQVGELHKLSRKRTLIGRSHGTDLRIDDDGLSREHAEVLIEGARITVRDLGSTNGTYVNGSRVAAHELHDGDKLSVGGATLLVFTHKDGIERIYERGRSRSALRDAATATLRSDVFLERLAEEISFSRRHAAPLAVMLWEIDGAGGTLSRGAQERDLLAALARLASTTLGDEDVLAVFGPGRFAVGCRETTGDEARERAERLRAAVAAATFGADDVRLTISVGVAPCPPGTDRRVEAAARLMGVADVALGRARASGGNRVIADLTASGPANP